MIRDLMPWRKKDQPMVSAGRNPFEDLHTQMNQLFDGFFDNFERSSWLPSAAKGLSPSFDVAETDEAIEVTAELPGMDEKDIDVTLDENVLTIKGEKKEEHEERKKDYHVSERSYGVFQRSFSLPEGIEKDKVDAKFKKGVLHVTLPKAAEVKTDKKKIDILSE